MSDPPALCSRLIAGALPSSAFYLGCWLLLGHLFDAIP
jgi:hypothetical protein